MQVLNLCELDNQLPSALVLSPGKLPLKQDLLFHMTKSCNSTFFGLGNLLKMTFITLQ